MEGAHGGQYIWRGCMVPEKVDTLLCSYWQAKKNLRGG